MLSTLRLTGTVASRGFAEGPLVPLTVVRTRSREAGDAHTEIIGPRVMKVLLQDTGERGHAAGLPGGWFVGNARPRRDAGGYREDLHIG